MSGEGAVDELLEAAGRGDRRAFELLYDRLAPVVFGVVRAVVLDPVRSEVVTGDVFIEVWRTAGRFRPEREDAVAWVTAAAHRLAVDHLRAARAGTDPAAGDRCDDTAARSTQPITRCLAALTQSERRSIVLAYLDGRTYHEVAGTLTVDPASVLRGFCVGLRQAAKPAARKNT